MSRPRRAAALLALIVTLGSPAALLPQVPAPPSQPQLLRPDAVFDAVDGERHLGWAVLMSDGRIMAVGPATALDPRAQVVDLPT